MAGNPLASLPGLPQRPYLTKYFPDAPATWKSILIKNLLSHTSGLSEYETGDRTGPKGAFYLRLDFTEDELATKIEALPIEWAPGDKWDYRNTNYILLGIIIHKVTGKPYEEFLGDRIFKPLDMTSTRLISDSDIIPNRSAGYEIHRMESSKTSNGFRRPSTRPPTARSTSTCSTWPSGMRRYTGRRC